MGAFYYETPKNIFFWLGAFSTHFIPAGAAFISYLPLILKQYKKYPVLFLSFFILLPQYYLIIKFDSQLTLSESYAVDNYIIHTFPKSLLYIFFFGITAFIGFKKYRGRLKYISPIMALIPVVLGVVSFANAIYHTSFNPLKSFYLSRMIMPIIIPSSLGILVLFKRYTIFRTILPLAGLLIVLHGHQRTSKDKREWQFIRKNVKNINSTYWTFVRYNYPETYIPAMGKPAWNSHYIITLASEFKNAAKESPFKYAFVRNTDPIKQFLLKKGTCIDSINNLYFIKFNKPIKGEMIISLSSTEN